MEINSYILLVIIATALVTFIPRVLPLVVLTRMELPAWFLKWLDYVPIAIIAALLGQEIFINQEGDMSFSLYNLNIIAIIPTFLVAIFSRSLLATVLSGVFTMMVVQYLF
ncbi:AzlD domain-containing protein [Shouchella tritolerans]|uniref:AzlD domain-containing protein n=1 Tax=Shouchella tritolerans TaxID=2979466 RepID=UPI0007887250|nr:AzlD domain-containing protein [Shouchella tritolerans]